MRVEFELEAWYMAWMMQAANNDSVLENIIKDPEVEEEQKYIQIIKWYLEVGIQTAHTVLGIDR